MFLDVFFSNLKILHVLPGHQLSLQYHHYRSENWVVTKGQATVILDGVKRVLNISEGIFIKCGAQHQLINNTDEDLVIIEVQTGTYFDEDDIVRISDTYNRI